MMALVFEKTVVLESIDKKNRGWMIDEFFDIPATRKSLLHLAQHYLDVVEHNRVCTTKDRKEFAQRARFLKRLVARMS